MSPGSPADPADRARRLKALALQLGFDLCGVAAAGPIQDGGLRAWLERGYAADMGYMARRIDERLDPRQIVSGARSVVVVAVSYFRPADEGGRPGDGLRRVARYARGRDYHLSVRRRLRKLRLRLLDLCPGAHVHPSVDTSPVMEKVWAQRAGLGWIGKNGLLIAPPFGSWVLLGTLITDAELAPDRPHSEQCGSCRACLPACPTGALRGEGQVDSRRCLSYWTIETAAAIPRELREACSDWTFGCDLCQEVCPWNREARPANWPDFRPGPLVALRCSELAELSPERFAPLSVGSPLRRPGLDGLRRSAALGLARQGDAEAAACAARLTEDPDQSVADAAEWSLDHLQPGGPGRRDRI